MNRIIPLLILILANTFRCDNFNLYKNTFKQFLQQNDLYQITTIQDTDSEFFIDINLKSQLKEHLASIYLEKQKNKTLISIKDTISQDYQRIIKDSSDNTIQFQQQIFEEIFKRLVSQPRTEVQNIFLEDLIKKIKKEMNYENFKIQESEDKKIFNINFMNEEAITLQVSIKIIGDLQENFIYDLKFSTDFYFSTTNNPQKLQWVVDIFGQNTLIKSSNFLSNLNFTGSKEVDFFDQFKLKGNFIDCNSKIIEMIGRSLPYLYKIYNYSPSLINYKDVAHLISKYATLQSVTGNYLLVSTFEPQEDQIGDHTVRIFKIDNLNQQINLDSTQAINQFKFYRMDEATFNQFMIDQMKLDDILENLYTQVVRIFKEEYYKVFNDQPQKDYQFDIVNSSPSYYTTFYIIVNDQSNQEFLRFDFQEYKQQISMTNYNTKSNIKFAIDFKTEDYTIDKFRHYIAMTFKAYKISK